MKINIFTVKTADNFYAGQKAPSDVVTAISKNYFVKTTFFDKYSGSDRNKLVLLFLKIFKRFKFTISFVSARIHKDIVILQFPMFETTKILNKLFLFNMSLLDKNTIILIHDIDGIRGQDERLLKQELDRMKKVGYIIAHNSTMKQELKKLGLKSKIYELDLFDYFCDYDNRALSHDISKGVNVIYAGNLSKAKSPFLHQLDNKKLKFNLNIYGIGTDKDISSKIKYKGKFTPNELPNKIVGDLGLIWDGNYDESDENIGMKNYTKYNNPHKLSCYIAAGIPVIAWRKSAIAKFIKENNIGYLISNIYDINNLDFTDYKEKLNSVKKLQVKVRNGYFTNRVLKQVLSDMKKGD